MFVAREEELNDLNNTLLKDESSLIVVYGRRRIGKTETIRHFISTNSLVNIEVSGVYGSSKKVQIKSFVKRINRFAEVPINCEDPILSWNDVFDLLEKTIIAFKQEKKKVIFIDEFPWLDTQKSGFLEAFSEFWNLFCSKRKDILVIVCGSAASYMINKIIRSKKTMHGRINLKINMKQFKLKDAKKMLDSKGCIWSNKGIVDTYIALGGVAKYLNESNCSMSPHANIEYLCFSNNALLRDEYEDLFESLFERATMHRKLMDKLATKWSGYTKQELSKLLKVSQSSFSLPLDELISSGFVSSVKKFGQIRREKIYRATDCFSYFHHKWIKNDIKNWQIIATSQSFKTWAGIAFENTCHIHIEEIKQQLGISGVETDVHYWSKKGNKEEGTKGAQIDMLIEHKNGSNNIEIIECKYYKGKFKINDSYFKEIKQKIEVFNEHTNFKYNIRLIFITAEGIEKDSNYYDIVNKELVIEDLFK